MNPLLRRCWPLAALAALALLPWIPGVPSKLVLQLKDILIFSILALGLNVVVGYTGLLNLGIAAFFGIGAYLTGILTVSTFPFQTGFWPALVVATVGTGLAGVLLATPTLRLRGDYLAIVTLGFGEVIKFAIKNLENITGGSKALNPIPDPSLPGFSGPWGEKGYFYLALLILGAVLLLLRNLERSRLGRMWMAIREDELAAACMGMNAATVKLSAFAIGSALAGLAGSLYAVSLDQTGDPSSYTFNRSITVLCFLIIGGMGNLKGAVVGTFVLMGYDNILTPWIDGRLQAAGSKVQFGDFKLIVFGLALIAMMRFRPEGIFPSRRIHDTTEPCVGVE